MRDIPIIFSAPMVQALLAGRKTQTRRLAWRSSAKPVKITATKDGHVEHYEPRPSPWQRVKPGARLWVRENFKCQQAVNDALGVDYIADPGTPPLRYIKTSKAAEWVDRSDSGRKAIPCIHMPRAFSRLTLVVTAMKIEALQAISEDDARAEGVLFHDGHGVGHSGFRHYPDDGVVWATAAQSFARLWVNLHGTPAWIANPEVVALTFTVHKANIDALPQR